MVIKHRPYAECALNKWYYLNTLTCRLLLLIYITWLFSSAGMHSPEVHTGARLQHRHSLACRALAVDGHLDSPTSSALVTSDVWRDPCQSHVCAVLALRHMRACLFSHVIRGHVSYVGMPILPRHRVLTLWFVPTPWAPRGPVALFIFIVLFLSFKFSLYVIFVCFGYLFLFFLFCIVLDVEFLCVAVLAVLEISL